MTELSRFRVPAISAGEMIPAGCCPVPAAAAAVQILMFVEGVEDVEVDEPMGTLTVRHDATLVTSQDLADELAFVGLPGEILADPVDLR